MLKISFRSRSIKNLLLSIDVVKSDKVSVDSNSNYKHKTVERYLLISKNLNKATNFLTPNAKQVFT